VFSNTQATYIEGSFIIYSKREKENDNRPSYLSVSFNTSKKLLQGKISDMTSILWR